MVTKIIIFILSFSLILSFNSKKIDVVQNNQYNDIIMSIAPYVFDDKDEKISRRDCITTIMKLLGVNDFSTDMVTLYTDYDQPIFGDIYGDTKNDGYIYIAKFENITRGVNYCIPGGVNNFEPNRNVTLKETLAFMLRCLGDPNSFVWESTMDDSVKFGLIFKEELDCFSPDEAISNQNFITLLYRILEKECHLYWPKVNSLEEAYNAKMQIDEHGIMRYIDWLNQ